MPHPNSTIKSGVVGPPSNGKTPSCHLGTEGSNPTLSTRPHQQSRIIDMLQWGLVEREGRWIFSGVTARRVPLSSIWIHSRKAASSNNVPRFSVFHVCKTMELEQLALCGAWGGSTVSGSTLTLDLLTGVFPEDDNIVDDGWGKDGG